ncbi:hypothetical protein Vadar_008362 [Vaccinium darrowii]|uniref:Uncharacterized protein n=1 Tax=Vaccinium darrowii TaxID=229202 RepID=A0ACB7XG22_9ERIC|nr:hypothetical protein Vadar_008362 [Vaccinium darrowii]
MLLIGGLANLVKVLKMQEIGGTRCAEEHKIGWFKREIGWFKRGKVGFLSFCRRRNQGGGRLRKGRSIAGQTPSSNMLVVLAYERLNERRIEAANAFLASQHREDEINLQIAHALSIGQGILNLTADLNVAHAEVVQRHVQLVERETACNNRKRQLRDLMRNFNFDTTCVLRFQYDVRTLHRMRTWLEPGPPPPAPAPQLPTQKIRYKLGRGMAADQEDVEALAGELGIPMPPLDVRSQDRLNFPLAKLGLVLLLVALALILVVNVHDLFAHLAGIDYRLWALVEVLVPVVQAVGALLSFLGVLLLFIQISASKVDQAPLVCFSLTYSLCIRNKHCEPNEPGVDENRKNFQ